MDLTGKKNILFLTSWYPCREDTTLGIFVKRHGQAIATQHKVTLLYVIADSEMKPGEFQLEKNELGNYRELIIHFGKSSKQKNFISRLNTYKLMRNFYESGILKALEWSGEFDLIHMNIPWPYGKFARLLSLKLKLPIVLTEHWTGYHKSADRFKGYLLRSEIRKTINAAHVVCPVSQNLMDVMQERGLKAKRWMVVPNVVDTSMFFPSSAERDPSKPFRFIHVSGLDDEQKNISGLLRAFRAFYQKNRNAELHMIGSGKDEPRLKLYSNELGLTLRGVFFKGRIEGQELAEAYRMADAFILTSRFENQPVVLLEALACGLPVISTNVGGISEVIHEGNGILIVPDDEQVITDALEKMVAKYDTFNRAAIRKEAVERYSFEAVSKAYSEVYKQLPG